CISVEYANLIDLPANNPLIDTSYINGLTSCIVPNGEFGLEVNPLEQIPPLYSQNRSYTFYTENNLTLADTTAPGVQRLTTIPAGPSPNEVTFIDVNSGDWTSLVVDNYTHCVSTPLTINISEVPGVIIQVLDSILPADCDPLSTGSFQFESSSGVNSSPGGAGFIYSWEYWGKQFTGPAVPNPGIIDGAGSDSFIQKRDSLISGYYVVSVVDNFTSCTSADTLYLPVFNAPPSVLLGFADAKDCIPGNGEITFKVDEAVDGLGNPVSGPANSYDIILYQGTTADPVNEIDRNVLAGYNITYTFGQNAPPADYAIDLPPGYYTLTTQENSTANKCFSEPSVVSIGLDVPDPVITAIPIPDFTCNAIGTGELSAMADGTTVDYSFEWFAGADTTGLFYPAGPNINSLLAGNYSVKVIDTNGDGNGCRYKKTFSLPKILKDIRLIPNVTPNNNCAPFDGSAQITNIEENVIDIGFLPGGYDNFTLFDNNFNIVSTNNTAAAFSALAPGDYYLRAQNILTECYTGTQSITIDDLSQDPIITIALNNPDYACDPLLANGELEATASGSQNLLEYDFTWHQGNVGDPIVSNLPLASNLTANTSTQLYTIEVVDIIGVNLGCISTKEYTLLHQPTTVSILSTDITNTDQTICGPNASIVLNRIFEDDGSGPIPTGPDYTGIYNAQLLDQNLDIINPLTNTYAAFNPLIGEFGSNNIPAATYYVQASNVVTGCAFGPATQVIIKDVSKNPIISATLDNPDYSCIGGTATGELTPIVFGGTDNDDANLNPARFSVTWIKNDGTNPITDDGGGTWLPRAINLDPVTYTMEVTDNFGNDQFCVSTRDYIVTAARHDIDITASGTDQTFCIPNGTIQIDNIDVDGVNVIGPHLAWTAILLDDSNNPVSPAPTESGFASNSDPLSNLYAGAYFVQAQDNLTKCYSDPYQVVIYDISENPVIAIDITSPQYSLNPNPASWTGAMQATVTELSTGAPDAGGYIYSWHLGNDDSNPSLSGLDNVSALDEGYYTFTAFNNNTGCESMYTQYMPFVYLEPLFNTSISPQTICSPYNGSIEVTDISLDGAPDMLSDYTFNWHHDIFNEGDTPDAIIPGNDVRTAYDNLNSGSYYILAKENWWMIESYPV
ncbi:MAG: hypothetical protein KAR17_13205, partial [Cyclobacteriaceae bacterium]|nr:hypothetical protein [Cyclobacteriaceae bacterium]